MNTGKKVLNFMKKPSKVADRAQEEILRGRKQKRIELIEKMKRKKNT
ncbi:hypothetical protein ACFQ88_22425 [Paenibacillus sp. NPDC056579]